MPFNGIQQYMQQKRADMAAQDAQSGWRNWKPGMATTGYGSSAGLRNVGLGAAQMSQWNAAAGDPAKQYALFQANPSLGNMAGTGINAGWINNNAYSNIGANGQNLGSNAAPLTPGTPNTSYNPYTSSFGNPQQPSPGNPPFGSPGGFGPPPPGGGANTAMQQFGQSTGIGGSWNPNIKPYIAPGQTGDTPGTYGQQAGMPGQPTGNAGQGGAPTNLQPYGTNYGSQTPGVLGSQGGNSQTSNTGGSATPGSGWGPNMNGQLTNQQPLGTNYGSQSPGILGSQGGNGQMSTGGGGNGPMPAGGWGTPTNLAAGTNYGLQQPGMLGSPIDPRALGMQQPAQTAQPNAGRVTGLRYGGY